MEFFWDEQSEEGFTYGYVDSPDSKGKRRELRFEYQTCPERGTMYQIQMKRGFGPNANVYDVLCMGMTSSPDNGFAEAKKAATEELLKCQYRHV